MRIRLSDDAIAGLVGDHNGLSDDAQSDLSVYEARALLDEVRETRRASAPRTGEGLEGLREARERLKNLSNRPVGWEDMEEARDEVFDALDKLLASPSTESVGGWSFDMKAAPDSTSLYLAQTNYAGKPATYSGVKLSGDFYLHGESHIVKPYAWMLKPKMPAPPLPDDQGGEG